MMTVGQPGPGAIGAPWSEVSPSRAAGKPPTRTVALPIAIPLGAGETHTMPPGSPFATAAGSPPISTVATAAAGVIGPPTCGFGPSESGQTTESPARSAGPVGTSGGPCGHGVAGLLRTPPKKTAVSHCVGAGVTSGGTPTALQRTVIFTCSPL